MNERTLSKLRQDYLKMIRGELLTTILAISVVDSEGNDVTPSKLVDEKSRTCLNSLGTI
ncbi:DUF896 domain-containing protein [Paenibacillus harenae]|uniref:DUF896 domain-containing protein n=1 Tax=Paenibacillus harenae TaxID=306543 RepID=UPI0024809F3C|nr:DUF896 domain-containing protein [Paenibacillus harenae]